MKIGQILEVPIETSARQIECFCKRHDLHRLNPIGHEECIGGVNPCLSGRADLGCFVLFHSWILQELDSGVNCGNVNLT